MLTWQRFPQIPMVMLNLIWMPFYVEVVLQCIWEKMDIIDSDKDESIYAENYIKICLHSAKYLIQLWNSINCINFRMDENMSVLLSGWGWGLGIMELFGMQTIYTPIYAYTCTYKLKGWPYTLDKICLSNSWLQSSIMWFQSRHKWSSLTLKMFDI